MEFGWINAFGAIIVVIMIIPDIVYAIMNKDEKNLCINVFMNVIRQIGRYACIVLMWLPLLVWKFGFGSVTEMMLYLAGNASLLLAYWVAYAVYMKHKSRELALTLAIIQTVIFLLSGLLLRHWLLVGFAVLFGIGHIYVTMKNWEKKGNEHG